MRRLWSALTSRGRWCAGAGLVVVVVSMLTGQRDVMRVGLLLLALPLVALVLVLRARLRMSAERSVEPAQVPLGSPLRGRITLGHDSLLPAALLQLEDRVPRELGDSPRLMVDRTASHWQRTVEYPLLGRSRGRYRTGPLMVRTTDPFGLVRMDRTFTATSDVVVTPEVFDLTSTPFGGADGSSGDAHPRRLGHGGADDVLVREYRQGDDVRRIHWRSTARSGELMVRREEQSLDPGATILLDTRMRAHAGRGTHHSLEWAVSAAASIGLRLLDAGYAVEVLDPDGSLDHGAHGTASGRTLSADLLLGHLTDLRATSDDGLGRLLDLGSHDSRRQVVVAVVGRLTPEQAIALASVRRQRATGLAMVLDVDSWLPGVDTVPTGPTGPAGGESDATARAAEILTDRQWRVVVVRAPTTVPQAWSALDPTRVAA